MTATRRGMAHLDGRSFKRGVLYCLTAIVTKVDPTFQLKWTSPLLKRVWQRKVCIWGSGQEGQRCGPNNSNVEFWLEHTVGSSALPHVTKHGCTVSEWEWLV